ncbi:MULTISPECIES: M28 family metallopeptidase [Dictyoglomus]|jgi:hypothetical protein|uniref:M28 family metallopeptidase n=1 Tax=Dictyoglomus TaxID=13 RepID=UPI002356771D|nr:M28 family peptidase [Dictyoglomus turgidum]
MRKISKLIAFLVILLLLLSSIRSDVRGDYALMVIRELSGVEYKGRQAGTFENLRALKFIEGELKKLGLKDVFYQEFPVEVFYYDGAPELVLKGKGKVLKKYIYRKDFRDRFSGSYDLEAEIKNNLKDIKGTFYFVKDRYADKYILLAHAYGAKGVILGLPEDRAEIILQKSMFFLKEDLPVIYITPEVFDEISNYMHSEGRLKAYYRIKYKKEMAKAFNLYFFIPSLTKTEKTIVITAHVDHVGEDYDGSYFPGANDNASGVGVLLEIAKEIWERGNFSPYNLLFLVTNGEEKGLLGSEYFVDYPPIPMDNIVLNINFDCVGKGENLIISYNTYASKLVSNLRFTNNNLYFVREYYLNESDQYAFHLYEKPFLFFIAIDKNEDIPDLHKKTDTVDKISKNMLSFTINTFFEILDILSHNSLN